MLLHILLSCHESQVSGVDPCSIALRQETGATENLPALAKACPGGIYVQFAPDSLLPDLLETHAICQTLEGGCTYTVATHDGALPLLFEPGSPSPQLEAMPLADRIHIFPVLQVLIDVSAGTRAEPLEPRLAWNVTFGARNLDLPVSVVQLLQTPAHRNVRPELFPIACSNDQFSTTAASRCTDLRGGPILVHGAHLNWEATCPTTIDDPNLLAELQQMPADTGLVILAPEHTPLISIARVQELARSASIGPVAIAFAPKFSYDRARCKPLHAGNVAPLLETYLLHTRRPGYTSTSKSPGDTPTSDRTQAVYLHATIVQSQLDGVPTHIREGFSRSVARLRSEPCYLPRDSPPVVFDGELQFRADGKGYAYTLERSSLWHEALDNCASELFSDSSYVNLFEFEAFPARLTVHVQVVADG